MSTIRILLEKVDMSNLWAMEFQGTPNDQLGMGAIPYMGAALQYAMMAQTVDMMMMKKELPSWLRQREWEDILTVNTPTTTMAVPHSTEFIFVAYYCKRYCRRSPCYFLIIIGQDLCTHVKRSHYGTIISAMRSRAKDSYTIRTEVFHRNEARYGWRYCLFYKHLFYVIVYWLTKT